MPERKPTPEVPIFSSIPTAKTISPTAVRAKLKILADAAKYDASCASSGSQRARADGGMGNTEGMGICHSYTPDGRCVSLLKILLTNYCVYDCKFCINRVTSDTKRARFTPEEVVWLTLEFYRRNYIEGLFLSSGIIDSPDATMLLLIRVAKLLRTEHRFHGYIHLKVVPGAAPELLQEAGLWADRVSANIELPTQDDLNTLAPAKKIETAQTSMGQIQEKIEESVEEKKKTKRAPKFAPAGQTTQMIVGATPSPDATILNSSENLYKKFGLRRVYYSAYSPIPHADAALPVERPHLQRENRLYQADWLIRFYGFQSSELTTTADPNLSMDYDPKTGWALRNRGFFPVDVNKASKEQLLRVPGLGVKNVERILETRPRRRLTLADLASMRVPLARTRFFILTADYNPDVQLLDRQDLSTRLTTRSTQLSLFAPREVKTGTDS
jgi:putative DNA modification/repair radical SAM protein